MIKNIKTKGILLVKVFFSFFQVIIEKRTPYNDGKTLYKYLFHKYRINYILDIGANSGQFVKEIITIGYTGNIISFEPLPNVYKSLKIISQKFPLWITENKAVGDINGKITMNVSSNTESSSVLPIADATHLPDEALYINTVEVVMVTLDTYFSDKTLSNNVYLKIDVQGFEESVLAGATQTLEKVKILQLELSFIPLYDNKKKYYQLLEEIEQKGFFLHSFLPAFVDNKTGQMYQMDAIFCRKSI